MNLAVESFPFLCFKAYVRRCHRQRKQRPFASVVGIFGFPHSSSTISTRGKKIYYFNQLLLLISNDMDTCTRRKYIPCKRINAMSLWRQALVMQTRLLLSILRSFVSVLPLLYSEGSKDLREGL